MRGTAGDGEQGAGGSLDTGQDRGEADRWRERGGAEEGREQELGRHGEARVEEIGQDAAGTERRKVRRMEREGDGGNGGDRVEADGDGAGRPGRGRAQIGRASCRERVYVLV